MFRLLVLASLLVIVVLKTVECVDGHWERLSEGCQRICSATSLTQILQFGTPVKSFFGVCI
ncbi:hypothetical protein DPMN_124067 [Dreissena polymorpha]|uniref:Uncharacterized protein n=1 Tax=Dreissena polymorpha TaxID=45954 RepID=A0A9D4GST6_DREPO|nr:hypothetical protein DPMN_124067 [Dreissena polymorpha]